MAASSDHGRPRRPAAAPAPAWRRALAAVTAPGFFSRFLLTLVVGVPAALLPLFSDGGPGHLRLSAAVAFAAGALFGSAGVAAVFASGWVLLLFVPGHPPSPLLFASVADGLLAACAWLAFRAAGGAGRGLPDLRSYLVAVAAGLAGCLAAAPLLAAASTLSYVVAVGLQLVANLAGVVLAGLPLLLFGRSILRRWTLSLPGERAAGPVRRLGGVPEEPSAPMVDTEATVVLPPPRSQAGRGMALGAAVILGVTLFAAPFVAVTPETVYWAAILYLPPVIWGARVYGLRGGVLVASFAGLVFLAAGSAGAALVGRPEIHPVTVYAQLLLLSPVGAYLGDAREREVRLRGELVAHARLLRQDLLRVVRALTAAIEAKDAYTESHLRRVGEYAVAVGARLGVHGRELEILYYAAMLHDVGKIGVPESVLRKRGPLDAEEIEQMRRHPEIGARIVRGLDLLSDAAPLILHHQERWDGGDGDGYAGYPVGLRGEEIPLGARIIAVVDAYDAMTTHRPYRQALPARSALEELRAEAGRQFDPRVVGAFVHVLGERPWGEE